MVGYHKAGKAGRGKGEGSESDPVERRSQEVLQALASVRDHKSKSTMRPRRLVASCVQLQRCVARPCGTLHGKQQGRTAAAAAGWGPAPTPIRRGPFWFSFDSTISTPGMHFAPLGECRLPGPPLEPGLGPVNDTVLPLLPSCS